MERDRVFAEDVKVIQDEVLNLVEATMVQGAITRDGVKDRQFLPRARRPDVLRDKLRAEEIAQIEAGARREVYAELEARIAALLEKPRQIKLEAMAQAAREGFDA